MPASTACTAMRQAHRHRLPCYRESPMPSSDVTAESILRSLNPTQRDAVTATSGPVLVVAGAGSGKTRVIAHRIAYLLGVEGVNPRRILAVTFTNKAAEEMRRRVEDLVLPAGIRPPLIATFHSACVRILRERAADAGLPPSFVIYDEDDRLGVVKDAMRELDFDERDAHARRRRAPDQLTSRTRCSRRTTWSRPRARRARSAWQPSIACTSSDSRRRGRSISTICSCASCGCSRRRRRRSPGTARSGRTSSSTSTRTPTARSTASSSSSTQEHRNLCVVGDPDQSMYRWRGADLRNILDFEKDYPDCRVVVLEQNYRSTKRILDIASAVIAHNVARKDKRLWTENGEGERASVFRAWDETGEAGFVAQSIRGGAPRRHRTTATWRSSTAPTPSPGCSRTRSGGRACPYLIVGGVRFYDRARDQGHRRLPAPRREPARRRGVSARRRRAPAAGHRQGDARTARRGGARAADRAPGRMRGRSRGTSAPSPGRRSRRSRA